jgi:hypothetical protein
VIATLGLECPDLSDLVDSCLAAHARLFPNVARCESAVVIGTADGTMHTFRKRQHLQHRLFTSPIHVVSVDPTGQFVAAASYDTRTIVTLNLPANGRAPERMKICPEACTGPMREIVWHLHGVASLKSIAKT